MKQKYIGRKAVNELRRRGKKVPDALTYEQIVEKINSAYLQVKAKDSDVIVITKTPTYEALMTAKTPAEKRSAARHFSKLHDDYKFSFRDMAILLNNIEYVDSPARPERQNQIDETLARKGERFDVKEMKSSPSQYSTPKGRRKAIETFGAKVRKNSMLTLPVFKRRLEKSMKEYPEYLKKLILGQMELKGDSWVASLLLNNYKITSLNTLLSSDRQLVEKDGENDIFEFFEFTRFPDVKDDYIFTTVNMTGKEFKRLSKLNVV